MFTFSGSVRNNSLEGEPDHFNVDVSLESDEDPEELRQLVALAHQSCYAENSLRNPVPVNTSHELNGDPLEVE